MNDKIFKFSDEILKRHLQRYTLEMIRLWLQDVHGVSVCKSSISRSIRKSLNSVVYHRRADFDDDYSYYRSKADLRTQVRNYKRHLGSMMGLIENYRCVHGCSAIEVLDKLKSAGVNTSLSSVYRALRIIDEREGRCTRKDPKSNFFESEVSSSDTEQSHVQLQTISQLRHIPQL